MRRTARQLQFHNYKEISFFSISCSTTALWLPFSLSLRSSQPSSRSAPGGGRFAKRETPPTECLSNYMRAHPEHDIIPAIKGTRGDSSPHRRALLKRDLSGPVDLLRKLPKSSIFSSASLVRAPQMRMRTLVASWSHRVTLFSGVLEKALFDILICFLLCAHANGRFRLRSPGQRSGNSKAVCDRPSGMRRAKSIDPAPLLRRYFLFSPLHSNGR